jgi:hypothetical protein
MRNSWWDYSDIKVVKSWLIKEVLLATKDAARLIDVPVHGEPNAFLMELSIKGLKLFHEMVNRGEYPHIVINVQFENARFKDMRLEIVVSDQINCTLLYQDGQRCRQLPVPSFKKWAELVNKIEDLWGFTSEGFICDERGNPLPVLLNQNILRSLDSGITWVPEIREFVRKR